MFLELLTTLISVFLMMLPGYISAKRGWISEKTLKELSALLVKFIYPCLIVSSLLNSFDMQQLMKLWFLPALCFGIMSAGFIYGFFVRRLPFFSGDEESRSFHFQCTMNNYSFVPMPIAYVFYGEAGIAAVIYASIGAETAMWTLGIGTLKGFSFRKETFRNFFAPPLLALYIALLLIIISGLSGFDLKVFLSGNRVFSKLMTAIKGFGAATIPMAMVICGARMGLAPAGELKKKSVVALNISRLILLPFLCISFLAFINLEKIYFDVLCIIAVMPCAVASILIAEIYGGDKDFTVASVWETHLWSLFTIPLMMNFASWLEQIIR